MSEFAALVHDLAEPIPGGAPAGEDPKYFPEYEFVKAEIAKMTSREWDKVVQSCEAVLTTRSKDIVLLCYDLVASMIEGGWPRAAAVGEAFLQLCANHWETIHPVRDRARQNAFKWLVEDRTLGTIEPLSAVEADHEALLSLVSSLDGIRKVLQERYPDDAPSIKPLIQAIQERANATKPAPVAAPAPKPEPVATPAPTESSSSPAPSASSLVLDGGSKTDLLRGLQKIALGLVASDPESPLGFKLLRMVRWQELTAAPRNEGGKTSLPPPNAQRRAWLEAQYQQRNWKGILEVCETAFTEPGLHLWLDLQFFAISAFEGKGLDSIAQVLKGELKALLGRIPTLPDLKYNDGTPFSSPMAKAWLDDLSKADRGGSQQSSAVREDTLHDDVQQAKELAAQGSVAEAVELLESGLAFGHGRSRAMRALEIAKLCLQNGKVRTARVVASDLYEKSQQMGLPAWEPSLAAEISDLHLKTISAAIDSQLGSQDELQGLRDRAISQIGVTHPSLLARSDF
ncbi:MAG: type VI secretion system protein TssA [Fibrobacteria bacterium]|nr:type VI secretion system protein TssA [Fibrobacteria bacterium]